MSFFSNPFKAAKKIFQATTPPIAVPSNPFSSHPFATKIYTPFGSHTVFGASHNRQGGYTAPNNPPHMARISPIRFGGGAHLYNP